MITYPRNFGEVRIGLVKVTSDTPAGVDFSDPTVTTQAVTNMSLVSATLNGYLANLGTSSSVEVSFEWGTTTNYGSSTAHANVGSGVTSVSVSHPLTTLSPATTYHCRVVAASSVGMFYGEDVAFTTPGGPPVVYTFDASGITLTSATLRLAADEGFVDSSRNGFLVGGGGGVEYWFTNKVAAVGTAMLNYVRFGEGDRADSPSLSGTLTDLRAGMKVRF